MNPASAPQTLRPALERDRANQPDPTFPQSPGIILETPCGFLSSTTDRLRSFNELLTSYQQTSIRKRFLMHNLLTGLRRNASRAKRRSTNEISV